jgi:hypothetical protein
MRCTNVPLEFLLEGGYLGTHDVLSVIQNGLDMLVNFFPNPFVLECSRKFP